MDSGATDVDAPKLHDLQITEVAQFSGLGARGGDLEDPQTS